MQADVQAAGIDHDRGTGVTRQTTSQPRVRPTACITGPGYEVRGVRSRFSGMERERSGPIGYCSRVISGLVVCAVVAVTLHAHVAALAILTAVTLMVLALAPVTLRGGR